jgi:hypothetical protein
MEKAELEWGLFECPKCREQETVPLDGIRDIPKCDRCQCEMTILEVRVAPIEGESTSHSETIQGAPVVRIKAKEIMNDIRSGMTDAQLMEKFDRTSKGLKRIFRKLVQAKAVKHSELYEKSPMYRDMVDQILSREFPRARVTVRLRIFDSESSDRGYVRDLSEKGLRVAGFKVEVGDTKTFLLPADLLTETKTIRFEAACRWVKTMGTDTKFIMAGFEIINISDQDQEDLLKFLRVLILSESIRWSTLQ